VTGSPPQSVLSGILALALWTWLSLSSVRRCRRCYRRYDVFSLDVSKLYRSPH